MGGKFQNRALHWPLLNAPLIQKILIGDIHPLEIH